MRIRHHLLLLFCIAFFVYLFSFGNQFIWDDEQFIYKNVFVQRFALKEIFTQNTVAGAGDISNYHRPLTTLSFAIDFQIWSFNVLGFHLTNTFLHIFSGMLLFILLLLLKFSKKISFWLAILFLLHPIQTEAVTYMNSRGDSLYTFFAFVSLVSLVVALKKMKTKIKLYNLEISFSPLILSAATVLTYTASIFSKEIGIATLGLQYILFFYFLLQEFSFKSIGKFLKTHSTTLITIGINSAVALFYVYLRSTALNFNNSFNFYSDGSLYSTSLAVRLLTFTKVIWIYFKLLLFPYPLHMERDTELVTNFFNFWTGATLLLLITLLYLGWREYIHKKSLYIWFGTAWFFCMLAPVSGIIPINGVLYEHWLYVPMIGFSIVLLGLCKLLLSNPLKLFLRNNQAVLSCTTFTILAILTLRQNYFWSTPVRFYEYLIQHSESGRVLNNLAMAYADAGQREKALTAYEKSLEFGDYYPQIHHNMGNTHRDMGNLEKAEAEYKKAIELSPTFFHSYKALAEIYNRQNKYQELLELAQKGQAVFINDPTYYYFEILALSKLGKNPEAEKVLLEMKAKFPAEAKTITATEKLIK